MVRRRADLRARPRARCPVPWGAPHSPHIVHPPILVLLSAGLSSVTLAAEAKFVAVDATSNRVVLL
jgi:hypothetical protein